MKIHRDTPRTKEALRALGRLVKKTLPDGSEVEMVRKFFAPEIRSPFNEETREVEVVASDGTIDRMGDIINPRGWMLKHYRTNPVVLVDHSYSIHSIAGTAMKTSVDNDQLIQRQRLDEPDGNESAATVARLLRNKMLRTVSVGFLTLDWEWRKAEEDDSIEGIFFKKNDLLEVSWVAVPANPNAHLMMDPADSPEEEECIEAERMAEEILARLIANKLDTFTRAWR
jgi:HK97 family phage prohead protease